MSAQKHLWRAESTQDFDNSYSWKTCLIQHLFFPLSHLKTSVTIWISNERFLNAFFPLQVTLSVREVKYRVRKHRNVQVERNASDCSRLNIFLLPASLTPKCSLSGLFWPLSWQMLPPLCPLKGTVGAPLVCFLFFPQHSHLPWALWIWNLYLCFPAHFLPCQLRKGYRNVMEEFSLTKP